ncbi:MAG: hypothetical protein ACR2PW_00625, partial [Gammaproteobacteria bacterium]
MKPSAFAARTVLTPVLALVLAFPAITAAQDSDSEIANTNMQVLSGIERNVNRILDSTVSLSVFPELLAENLALSSIEELAAFSPNTVVNSAPYSLSMRGDGGVAAHPAADSSVVRLLDGSLVKDPVLPLSQSLFLSEQINSLRGAQDTVRGQNAVGGILERISSRPKFDKNDVGYDFRGRVAGNGRGSKDFAIAVSGAATPFVGYRFAALQASPTGYLETANKRLDTPGTGHTQYQEVQFQLGQGKTGKLWLRSYYLGQDLATQSRSEPGRNTADFTTADSDDLTSWLAADTTNTAKGFYTALEEEGTYQDSAYNINQ